MTTTTGNISALASEVLDRLREQSKSEEDEQLHSLEAKLRSLAFAARPHESLRLQTVTVLMADIRGFSALAESLPSLQTAEMLNEFFATTAEVVEAHGGRINKLLGDGMMVLFGLPHARQDDVARAIACAVEMQQSMSGLNEGFAARGLPSLFLGIGINTGEMVVGRMGSSHYSEITVVGENVNIASRIEAHALRGQVLLGDKTYLQAAHFCETGDPRSVHIKGSGEPLKIHTLRATHWPTTLTVPVREQRQSVRVSCDLACHYFTVTSKVVDDRLHTGQVVDISYGGFKLDSLSDFNIGTEVVLSLGFGAFSDQTARLYVRLVSCEQHDEGYFYGAAISSAEPEALDLIRRFVDSVVEKG